MIRQLRSTQLTRLLSIKALATMSFGLLAILSLTACSSFSGLDAKGSFSCKAPDGVLCESMSGIYSTAMQNSLPGQQVNQRGSKEGSKEMASKTKIGVMTTPIYSGMPIRTVPRILRVWFAPWEDNDGDLHDQSYVYLPIDSGRWVIEHNRHQIQETYRPIRAASDRPKQPFFGNGSSSSQSHASESQSVAIHEEAVTIGIHQGRADIEPNALLSGMTTPGN